MSSRESLPHHASFLWRRIIPTADHRVFLVDLARLSKADRVDVLTRTDPQGADCGQRDFQDNADLEFRMTPRRSNLPVVALGDLKGLACKDAGINYQRVNVGMQEKGKSDLADRLLYEGKRQRDEDKMFWKGADIDRYRIAEATDRFCRPYYRQFIRDNEVVHLGQGVYDTTPKILLRQTADRIIATTDYRGVWFGRSISSRLCRRASLLIASSISSALLIPAISCGFTKALFKRRARRASQTL